MKKNLILFTTLFLLKISFLFSQSEKITGKWSGEITKEGKKWKCDLNIYEAESQLQGYFDVPDYGLYHLFFNKIEYDAGKVNMEYADKDTKVSFNGNVSLNSMSGDWEGIGIKAAFSLHRISEEPVILKTEEIFFENNDAKLAGTLIYPSGNGPFPAVIQVHGSGNQTRSEDFYRSRAYLLAMNGIACLIFDRRGKGQSTGSEVSMELLADDAIAGVHYLQNNPFIKKNEIGIMGFSQGGYIAPLAARRSKDIAFVITGAAPGITPNEQNDFNVENSLRKKKVDDDSIAYVLKFRNDLRNFQYNSVGDQIELEAILSDLKTKSWFKNTLLTDEKVEPVTGGIKDFLIYNPLPAWENVDVPVLLIWGEKDMLVPAEKSKTLIEAALIKGGNKNFQTIIYPNSTHGIESINNSDEWDFPRLAEGYHNSIVEWIFVQLKN